MRVFVVNLDKDVTRWDDVHARLAGVGIVHERVSAVYGRQMSRKEKDKVLNRFRWWCATGRHCEDGELGCAISHLVIYRKMIDEGVNIACVFEDDVVFDQRMPEQLNKVSQFLNSDSPRVVLLSSRKTISDNYWRIEPILGDFGTFAYMINLSGAKAILSANLPVQRPADQWSWWRRLRKIELYHAIPIVCDYDKSAVSSTAPKKNVKDYPLPKWLVHKFLRVIGKTLDRILG